MIRYAFDQTWVEKEIEKIDNKWLKKAAIRTKGFIEKGFFEETSSIWSSVKPVYMVLQNNKCIFCERQFEGVEYGRIEHDLEHFRPKGTVDVWPGAGTDAPRYDFATGDKFDAGYYWLAYDLHNYAAACKVCNSTFKDAFFPIGADRVRLPGNEQDTPSSVELMHEKPLLCYPLGEIDDDPEDLITFRATTAVPVDATGHKHERAKVMIDFFGLNEREQLHLERARMISLFGSAFEKQIAGVASAADLQIIQATTAPHLPHSACLKAFARLWENDVPLAKQTYEQCRMLAVRRS
jgi:hypothetical protein